MMAPPYLVEIRTGGNVKHELREIINDVGDEFEIYDLANPRAVPHIPLFGRYNTGQDDTVKQQLVDVLSEFDLVPYRITGFGANGNTIFAKVVPSVELVLLRQRIYAELRPLVQSSSEKTFSEKFTFHIPIARNDRDTLTTTAILEYVRGQYDPLFDEYAARITSLRGNEMLWEYDILQDRLLSHQEATAKESWKHTMSALNEQKTSTDHESLLTNHVGIVVAVLKHNGWRYYSNPHEFVISRARKDGLYQANGDLVQRRMYVGENFVYLALPTTGDDICVFSQPKTEFYESAVKDPCPICGQSLYHYDETRILPCATCDFQYDLSATIRESDTTSVVEPVEMCSRCKRPTQSDGVKFDEYVYCEDCMVHFKKAAENGVVVQSRHNKSDHEEQPYLIQWGDENYVEHSQVSALARGKEISSSKDIPGLFVYRRSGSRWLLSEYLDAHPKVKSNVRKKRQEIRGEKRILTEDPNTIEKLPDATELNISADGDLFIADNAIKDAVINRANIGNDTQEDSS